MARKSRKSAPQNLNPAAEIAKEEFLMYVPTAAYGRLSIENGGCDNDDSIQNQMKLIYQYVEEHAELELVDSYIDNGFTGTNFDRPEFKRMMEDVRTGRIRCIVVKDLSRFGRDYLETGYYIETFLPHMNVRLVSVTDDFDTFRSSDLEGLAFPVRNIVNSMYARDVSRKICASNEIRRKKGIGLPYGNAPFGYVIDKEHKKYIVDPNAAVYVRTLFQWARMGLTGDAIARRMNMMQLPTPEDYRRIKRGEPSLKRKWTYSTVRVLLQNPGYVGDTCFGRLRQALYKSESVRKTSREEWTIIEDTHEPLISKKDHAEWKNLVAGDNFYTDRFKKYNLKTREEFRDQMQGMVYCKECGYHMNYFRYRNDYSVATEEELRKELRGKKNGLGRSEYYICNPDSGLAACGGHRISTDLLKIIVMDQLELQIRTMVDMKKLLESATGFTGGRNPLLSAKKKLDAAKAKVRATENKIAGLYEDYREGIIEYEDYKKVAEDYEKVKESQEEECKLLERQSVKRKLFLETLDGTVEALKDEDTGSGFNEKLVAKTVERIDVSASGNVEIRFTFQDVLEQIGEIMKEANAS